MRISTGENKIHWGWLLLLSIPVAAFAFVEKCSGTALTFTLRKYISSPGWIVFLGSINSLFAVVIAPWAAYHSDFFSTCIGRRKTLIAVGFVLLAISLVLIPGASNFLLLVILILFYQFSVDLGYTGPWKPLYFDIVPKAQRGRGMVINRYASIIARFIFMFFLIGRFDQSINMKKTSKALSTNRLATLSGEQVIYFSAALLVIISLVIILVFVKEKKLPQKKKKISLAKYLRQMFMIRRNLFLCILVISSVLMSTKLMNLRPLLITEQFGYSKQMFGNMHSITMLVNVTLVLPVIAILIDNVDKFKIFAFCIILSTLHPAFYWTYVKFFTPQGIPSASAIVIFNVADSVFDRTAILALWPFLFDMVAPEKKGFMNSGFLIVAGLVKFININLMGIWVQIINMFTSKSDNIDYMNCYIYIFIVGIIGCVGTILFAKNRSIISPKMVFKK